MGHFRSDLRDVEFDLFEVFRVQDGPAAPDVDTRPRHPARPARASWTASPPARSPRASPTPTATRRCSTPRRTPWRSPSRSRQAYRLLWDGEWWRLGLPPELGGLGVPATVQWAAAELILGANPAVFLYLGRSAVRRDRAPPRHPGAAALGRADDRARLGRDDGAHRARRRLGRRRGPHAGRSQQPDGTWHLDGVKRFITSAEHDLTENIVHLVLARPEGPGITPQPGTKGLSLFLVPKFRFDPATGELGRAQRRVRHERRAQDGPQGVRDLRADVRPARRPRGRLAARRGARRHRADVRGDRVRPDDGGHQGHRHAVGRLPRPRWRTRRSGCRARTSRGWPTRPPRA